LPSANSLDIGEALGHAGWWYNATHFQETINVVDSMITFILGSANPRAFTLGAGNEAGDTGLAHFGTPDTISYPDGVNYYNSFMKTVYALLQTRAPFVPLMIQDSFMGASYWAPFWNKGDNIVFDSHFYFCELHGIMDADLVLLSTNSFPLRYAFLAVAAAGVYGNIIPEITCGQASSAQTDFPVFVGEWSLEAIYNNTLDGRASLYQSQQYAYSQYLSGGAFWGYKSVVGESPRNPLDATVILLMTTRLARADTTTKIDGEGTKVDYWNWRKLAEAGGIVLPGGAIEQSFC
jgi:glucan 1,3-beta-glucosidase